MNDMKDKIKDLLIEYAKKQEDKELPIESVSLDVAVDFIMETSGVITIDSNLKQSTN